MCEQTLQAAGSLVSGIASVAAPIAGLFGRGAQAGAQVQEGEYLAQLYETRARELDRAAGLSIAEGYVQEQILRERGRRVIAGGRAAAGASGVVVDSGSTLDALADSVANLERDALNVRYSAYQEARARSVQAGVERAQGEAARRGARIQAGGTLLSAFGSESWARLSRPAESDGPSALRLSRGKPSGYASAADDPFGGGGDLK